MNRWLFPLMALAGGLVGAGTVAALDRPGDEVRDYLLAHPEVIPEAMQKLQEREAGRSVSANRAAITTPFGSAFAGNPKGDVTLVEYYDYNCGYCRASLPAIRQLIAEDPKLRVVFRELPILAESSRSAARISLVAAAQGKFNAFHDALYASGRVSDASIAAAARAAGVDTGRLAALAPRIDAEIARNMETAARLGVTGTPSWVIGDRVLSGALPVEELKRAIAAARTAP
jgi:protein-disulfide isomerase